MVKFIDEAKIYVKSGAGGRGCVSFRREKYVPRGGPNGGDGGNGGDVVIITNENMSSLLDHRYKQHYKAKRGEHGRGKDQHGKNAETLYIPVPLGTIIRDFDKGEVLGDLTDAGETLLVAKGGRGGKGNARFATSTNQAPRTAEPGGESEERTLILAIVPVNCLLPSYSTLSSSTPACPLCTTRLVPCAMASVCSAGVLISAAGSACAVA